MNHPNIAKVFDAGATDTGRPYFVMELVDGIKITDFCDQNNFSTCERLELFIHVCHAVQHAHQKGIIHRDIKPSNILVTMTDSMPVPKVIDFGIAKATHGKLTDETFFTALEQFIGTPAYMSPEQADAREVDVDTRSDVYSLGVLLYELLTGRTPFDAKELLQSGLDEIRRTIREQEPAAPSTQLSTMQGGDLRAIAKHRKTDAPQLLHLVRGDLDWIVMKALEKDRGRRYETTNGLAMDIRRHLSNEPVAARPPSRTYQFQKLVRRNKLIFAAGAAIALALAIGVAISVWASIKEHQARLEADKQRLQAQANEKKAEAEAAKSQQVAQFLEDMLNGVGPSVAMGADTTLLKKILDNTSKRIGKDLTNEPEVEADLRNTLGEVYWQIGDLTNAEAMDRRSVAIRIRVLGPHSPEIPRSMEQLSHVLWREGKLSEAESLARSGIFLQTQLYGVTNLEVARSLEDYAAILNTKGFGARAVSTLRQSLATKETVLSHDNLEVADTLDDLGGLLLSMHSSVPQAEAISREALAIREKLLGATNPFVIMDSLRMQVIELDIQGRSSDEETALYKLVAVKRQLYGDQHPDLAQSLNMLASVLQNEGKLAQAEPVRREALAMQQKLLGGQSAEVAQTLSNLGQLLIAENKLAEAEPMIRNCYEMRRKKFGDGNAITASSLIDLGKLLEDEGKVEDATNLYFSQAGGSNVSAASADYCLGLMYLDGKSVDKDPAKGAWWMARSANLGHNGAQIDLGVLYFNGIGVPKDEDQAMAWFHKVAASSGIVTMKLATMKTLANCYCAIGRSEEAIATLKKLSESYPRDMDNFLTLATWQAWFVKKSPYDDTRRLMMQSATNTDDASTAEIASKAWCLETSSDSAVLAKALKLAQFGVERRKDTPWLPWCQLSLGMVQYRDDQYKDAEKTLALAEQNSGKYKDVPPTARFFRAMCLFREGRATDARQLFRQADAQMTPYPADPNKPVVAEKLLRTTL